MSQINVNTIANVSGTSAITQSSIGRFYKETDTDISGSAYKEWTNIPSWAQRIVVSVQGMNQTTSAISSSLTLRVGTGGSISSSGYVCSSSYQANTDSNQGAAYDTTGFYTYYWTDPNDRYGSYELIHMGSNKWVCRGLLTASANGGVVINTSGYTSLSGALDTVRIGSYNNTITHTSSFVSIMYQGL